MGDACLIERPGLVLTDYGHMLAERASNIYAEAEEAEDFARETSSRPRGLVKLSAPMSWGTLGRADAARVLSPIS